MQIRMPLPLLRLLAQVHLGTQRPTPEKAQAWPIDSVPPVDQQPRACLQSVHRNDDEPCTGNSAYPGGVHTRPTAKVPSYPHPDCARRTNPQLPGQCRGIHQNARHRTASRPALSRSPRIHASSKVMPWVKAHSNRRHAVESEDRGAVAAPSVVQVHQVLPVGGSRDCLPK